jgi:DNA polymerase-4
MPSSHAYRLCPQGIFISPRGERYKEVSLQIMKIFKSVSDKVQPLSVDEAFIDVTKNSLDEPYAQEVAQKILNQIKIETGLSASAGVAPNKFVAKIASDIKKPGGLVVVPPHKVESFLAEMPIEKMYGVGPSLAKKLHKMNIFKIEDIRKHSALELRRFLGKFGPTLYDLSFGVDHREVSNEREVKSVGSERTFSKDIISLGELESYLLGECEEVAKRLKRKKIKGKTITLKLKYFDFRQITRAYALNNYTDDSSEIFAIAKLLLYKQTEAGSIPARLIGVTLSKLDKGEGPKQLALGL